MRKAILSMTTIFALAFCANAQVQQTVVKHKKPSIIGYRIGLNLSDLLVENVQKETPKIGFAGGFYIKLALSEKMDFVPEINYTYNGAKLTYINPSQGTGQYRFNLGYIQIPALFAYKVTKTFKMYAGPYVAFLTDVNIKRLDSDNGAVTSITNLKKDDFNRNDVGAVAGISFDINKKVTIGSRYSYGFNEVGKTDSQSGNVTQNSRNSVLNLYLSIGF